MADIAKLNKFTGGTLADPNPVNENFEILRVAVNENTSNVASLNENKLDKDLSNISEEGKSDLLTIVKSDVNGFAIGQPQITLSNTLNENEIWLEGAVVSRTTYAELYKIYGTTYGAGDGSTTFKLPDFKNRAIWGSNGFGYISAGVPDISGTVLPSTGDGKWVCGFGTGAKSSFVGAFYKASSGSITINQNTSGEWPGTKLGFKASKSNSLYGKSSTVQPNAIKVRVKTRYK